MVWAYAQKGMFEEAFAEIESWRRTGTSPGTGRRGFTSTTLGRQSEARDAIEKLEEWARDRPADPMSMLPAAYLGVNQKEKAFVWLEKALRERSSAIIGLKVDPLYDPLREDPRFQYLLRRAGLGR